MVLTGYGFVKEVISGDTLVIIGQPRAGPPPELRLTLSSLVAPRLALKPTTMSASSLTTKDQEPFAWESRQFLRSLVIGKKVYFKVEYVVQAIGRQFGAVYLLDGDKNKDAIFGGNDGGKMTENICVTIAREGWCDVKVRESNDNEKSGDLEEMIAVNKKAKEEQRGIFNKAKAAASVRTVTWDFLPTAGKNASENGSDEVTAFYNKVKKGPQKAIIEYIRDGASMKALLLDSMTLITFNLAGIQCPRMNLGAKNEDDPQEYAQEAKFFTEIRLLNREVLLNIGGVSDKYASFFGSILYTVPTPTGVRTLNPSVELVKNGLATPADWSMSYTTPAIAAAIHAAVHVAKKAKLRLWKTYVPPIIPGDKVYSGVVAEVSGGDSLVVRVGTDDDLLNRPWVCEERKINLSSIRAPRSNRNEADEPFAREAKEFLRSKLVGKLCDVQVEYIIDGAGGSRQYGTVFVTSKNKRSNVAALLLEEGLASLIGHKQGAERSEYYHELIEAEKRAKDNKKNVWSGKETVQDKKPVEVSNANLAKSYLPTFRSDTGEKLVNGVVDYVINGAKLKIFVPDQNAIISLNLSGIQAPSTKGKDKSEPFADESIAFTKSLCQQREIDFSVEGVDRGGNYIGTAYVKRPKLQNSPKGASKTSSYASRFSGNNAKDGSRAESLSNLLLQHGLAKTNKIGIRFAKYASELVSEEKAAKEAKINIWEKYVEEAEETEDEVESPTNADAKAKKGGKKLETVECSVCHIDNGNEFFVQVGKESDKMKEVNDKMSNLAATLGLQPRPDAEVMTKIGKGQNVVCLFNDGTSAKWYRARVLAMSNEDGEKKAQVLYIDFGNQERVGNDRLRVVSDDFFSTPGLAHAATLAFLHAPNLNDDYGVEAAMYLSQLSSNKKLTAKLHTKDKEGKLVVTLIPAGQTVKDAEKSEEEADVPPVTVNGLLVRQGLATVAKRARTFIWGSDEEKAILDQLKKDQNVAHNERLNLWQYGDPTVDDDERF